jgi:phage terminase large subunit-like protein
MSMFSVELPADKVEVLTKRLLAEQKRRVVENALLHYRPYQKQLDFHAAGATHR